MRRRRAGRHHTRPRRPGRHGDVDQGVTHDAAPAARTSPLLAKAPLGLGRGRGRPRVRPPWAGPTRPGPRGRCTTTRAGGRRGGPCWRSGPSRSSSARSSMQDGAERGAHPGQRAGVGLDADPLEERDARGHVNRAQVVLGRGQQEQLPTGRASARGPRPTPYRSWLRSRLDAPHSVSWCPLVSFKMLARTRPWSDRSSCPHSEVGAPLHLDGVGHVEPLPRLVGPVQEQVGTGVSVEVGEAEGRAGPHHPVGVPTAGHPLGPDQRIGRHPGRNGPVARWPAGSACSRSPCRPGPGHGPGPPRGSPCPTARRGPPLVTIRSWTDCYLSFDRKTAQAGGVNVVFT